MIKRSNRLALAAMRTTAVVWSSAYEQSSAALFDFVLMARITPNQFHRHAVSTMQHKWQMTLIVVGVESCGRKHIKRWTYNLLEPRLHTSIIPHFNIEHSRLLNSLNPKHDRQAAWIATTERVDFTDEQIVALTGL